MIRTLLQQRCKEETHVVKEAIDATGFGEEGGGSSLWLVSFARDEDFCVVRSAKKAFLRTNL